jgi:site-specific DNA-cytosine methylase
MVRFAELASPRHVVLENVRGVVHDRAGVFQMVREELERLGYRTAQRLLEAEAHGVPQLRRRMFMVATREPGADPEAALALPTTVWRSFAWACSDLESAAAESEEPFDMPPKPTARNQKRIDYLFRHQLWEPQTASVPCVTETAGTPTSRSTAGSGGTSRSRRSPPVFVPWVRVGLSTRAKRERSPRMRQRACSSFQISSTSRACVLPRSPG